MRRAEGWCLVVNMLVITGCAAVDAPEKRPSVTRASGIPGETLGNDILQRDTRMPVMMAAAAKIKNKDCPASAFEFEDTKVLSQPKEVENMVVYTRWRELWTVKACNETVDVEVTYLDHFLDGTSIHAK